MRRTQRRSPGSSDPAAAVIHGRASMACARSSVARTSIVWRRSARAGSSVRRSQPTAAASRGPVSGPATARGSTRRSAAARRRGWSRRCEEQGGADYGVVLRGKPGGEGCSDRALEVGGGGQSVGGVDADGGVGVVEKGQECRRFGGDRGSGSGYRPACGVAGHLHAVVVEGVASRVGCGGEGIPRGRQPRSAGPSVPDSAWKRVTYQIVWDEPAIDAAARFLKDDADGLRQLMDAVELLADQPRPEGSTSY